MFVQSLIEMSDFHFKRFKIIPYTLYEDARPPWIHFVQPSQKKKLNLKIKKIQIGQR
jgi:hypothetical protein